MNSRYVKTTKSQTLPFADFWILMLCRLFLPLRVRDRTNRRKTEKKSAFPNQCFVINSPTFSRMFPLNWCRWLADTPLSSSAWKLLVDTISKERRWSKNPFCMGADCFMHQSKLSHYVFTIPDFVASHVIYSNVHISGKATTAFWNKGFKEIFQM